MEVIGIDAQARGIAVAVCDFNGKYIDCFWIPIEGKSTEEKIAFAYKVIFPLTESLGPELVGIELPTAVTSSSSIVLWGIYGAVVAAIYPNCTLIQGIVPSQWKKYSGLNVWAKEHAKDKRGIIIKNEIKNGLIDLYSVPDNLTPVDLYDSIAIAIGTAKRNLERVDGYRSKKS